MDKSRDMAMTLGPHLADEGTDKTSVLSKEKLDKPVVGRVLDRGYSDEFSGREYMVVAGHDGVVHYVNMPFNAERLGQEAKVGDTVEIARRETTKFGTADKNIQAVAQQYGTYSAENHLAQLQAMPETALQEKLARLGPDVTIESYVEAHANRAARHASHGLITEANGGYTIPGDFAGRVAEHTAKLEAAGGRDKDLPARVSVVLHGEPKKIVGDVGYTALDRDLQAGKADELKTVAVPTRTQAAYLEALEARTDRLIRLGLAEQTSDGKTTFHRDLPKKLSELELQEAGAKLGGTYGRYIPLDDVRRFKGEVAGVVALPGGPQAVIRSADTFTLVPADSRALAAQGKQVEVALQRGRSVTDWSPEGQRRRVMLNELERMEKKKDLGLGK